jgi:ergothioneine biosynthesis protein EgtB
MRATADSPQERFRAIRTLSVQCCQALELEDYGLQAAGFASPPKWHLAHTSWFFETFLLKTYLADYQSPDDQYEVLFNSYYQGVGEQFPRAQRGLLSRPTVAAVLEYRAIVDSGVQTLLADLAHPDRAIILERLELGINHEQQHQELFFTDIKYSLSINPLFPAYAPADTEPRHRDIVALQWLESPGGLVEIGSADEGFCFDNELPRHKVWLEPYAIANRLVSNAEYQQFVDDSGYQRAEFWLADGWNEVQTQGWRQPLNWRDTDSGQVEYSLYGLRRRRPEQPVCHLSGYEADAYASWAGARLPTEAEWEHAASSMPINPTSEHGVYHPQAPSAAPGLLQLASDCWQWTRSAYEPYPGFTTATGAIGEYNGKFMTNQWVLRGGSCVSSPGHLRTSYRNFFYPQDRWQFSGLRLAKANQGRSSE